MVGGLRDSFTVAHPSVPAVPSTIPKGKGLYETLPNTQTAEGSFSVQHESVLPFPIPSTMGSSHMMRAAGQLDFNQLMSKKTMPLPVKMLQGEREDDDYYGCPILEKTPSDDGTQISFKRVCPLFHFLFTYASLVFFTFMFLC